MSEEVNKIFQAMSRYRGLYDKFPLSVQKLLVTTYGDRHSLVNDYTEQEIHAICDKMQEALDVEEKRLYDLYKNFLSL